MKKFLVLFFLFFYACSENSSSTFTSTPLQKPIVEQFVELINAHRQTKGCPDLTWSEPLAVVAFAHSQDMLTNNFFDHTNLSGESPFDRMDAAGIVYSAAAENIAWDAQNAQSVLSAWLESAGHKVNIENCAFTKHGVGLAAQTPTSNGFWTHVFTN